MNNIDVNARIEHRSFSMHSTSLLPANMWKTLKPQENYASLIISYPPRLERKETMQVKQIRGCENGGCPKVFRTDKGTFLVQGATVDSMPTPEHETVIEVPAEILRGL